MPQLQAMLEQVGKLDDVEREELFMALSVGRTAERPAFMPAHPSIVRTPGVCGGSARLIRTRIPVWTLARMRQLGVSEADILANYPSLGAADLVQAWSFAATHAEEIEKEIRENEEE